MSTYPMDFQKLSWIHKGGTKKEYHIILVVNGDGRATVIRRFGKSKAATNVLAEIHSIQAEGERSVEGHIRERAKKGYELVGQSSGQIQDAAEMVQVCGRIIFPKLGPAVVKSMDPAFDTSRMREP